MILKIKLLFLEVKAFEITAYSREQVFKNTSVNQHMSFADLPIKYPGAKFQFSDNTLTLQEHPEAF